jgi:hypothetical protein
VLRRQVDRPSLTRRDRWWMVAAARVTKSWETALLVVQPTTLLRWHREMYRWWCVQRGVLAHQPAGRTSARRWQRKRSMAAERLGRSSTSTAAACSRLSAARRRSSLKSYACMRIDVRRIGPIQFGEESVGRERGRS